MAALTVRTLWAAYPGNDPRTSEGVVAIDDVDLYQDMAVQEKIATVLRTALPRVQWLLTTSSPIVASSCDAREILTLRRLPGDERVELFRDEQARTH
jgi:predicted ATP-binding protein involved in virulence